MSWQARYFLCAAIVLAAIVPLSIYGLAVLGQSALSPAPIYDASCLDVARAIQRDCFNTIFEPCDDVFTQAYETCRNEVEAGRPVRHYGDHFVPAELIRKGDP